ncbi:cyclopropane-fatty-acyl-phospholipid synthase [Sinorhizobium medicae]|uniref:cyclopropane-fatty-acyl-phospholipid synthase n=1 Tax=Sinorhizobium medicae TaxID=110321 RepID=UPI000C7DF336|nr:cyclopropane-fatty-acyl-phospholipid synthase [Sinorhizobium medicae]PLU20135.1 SAM-dependent methyltransferase [Sinorhizobium medicae]PLU38336.1 SAM-dependent methyltransferase [Sinorhizobium medicae]PLU44765.1 SAM-dependent methyltransferase [Sinorhizobium medicae]PLU60744.1 SAM-dependent methyltransferase [Sinorhizobium medicae]PLU69054.1 SAM-dependent methyltransferase [Sinorhizobium medicae]
MFPLSHMMKAFIRKGTLTVIDADGKRHVFAGEPGPSVTMRLTDKRLYRSLVFNAELAAGEAYMDGTMLFEEGSTLRDFLTLFSINRLSLGSYPIQKLLRAVKMRFRKRQQANPQGKAQENVAHHYDLGNDFYKLFLDQNMLYSCAYFREPDETLEAAQRNKLRLLGAKLCLKPGMKVLDIGCGWGDLALYLAALEDVEVLGVTLSKEQQALASERARAAGMADRVRFELKDYRDVEGPFDRIVSVGMFEHVGVHHYDEFFKKLNALMPDDGLAVLHSIGHMSPPGMASAWLRKYIFPGAYSPALSEVFEVVEGNSLWVTDLEFLRVHYATTLAHWGARFEQNRDKVIAMYDERFARMWEFYLISAEMMFRTGSQLVFHMQLSRSRDAAPIVRDYITDRQRDYVEKEKALDLTL